MKKQILSRVLYGMVAVLPLLMAGCSDELTGRDGEPLVPVELAAGEPGEKTRTSTDIQSTNFNAGEQLNVYFALSNGGHLMTNDGVEIPEDTMVYTTQAASGGLNVLSAPTDKAPVYFPNGTGMTLDIFSLYPKTVNRQTTVFTVDTIQKTDATYMANDLMFASINNVAKINQVVHLQYAHKMAKLIVNTTGEDDVQVDSVKLKNFRTTATFDPTTGLLTDSTDVKDICIDPVKGVALFPPQTIQTDFIEVYCTYEGVKDTAFIYIDQKTFREGRVYTVNLTVGAKNLDDIFGKVAITGWSDAAGMITVAPVGSSGLTIEGDIDDVVYNGKYQEPTPLVTDGKLEGAKTLTLDQDYEFTYYNNLNVGKCLVVASGKKGSMYEGITAIKTFNITRAENPMNYPSTNFRSPFSNENIVRNPLKTPSLQEDSLKEIYGNITYTIEYTGNDTIATLDDYGNVKMLHQGGPATITATMDSTGNFKAKTVKYTLNIVTGDAREFTVVLHNADSLFYTGNNITPPFTVYDNGWELYRGVDYTFNYIRNVNAADSAATNAPAIQITGMGKYGQTKTVPFSIYQAKNEFTNLVEPTDILDVGATAISPQYSKNTTLTIAGETHAIEGKALFGTVLYSSSNNSIATVSTSGLITPKGVGDAIITVRVAETTNWAGVTKTFTVRSERRSRIFVYNGTTSSNYQVRGGSAQVYTQTFTHDATVTAELIGAGGGNDGSSRGGLGGHVKAQKRYKAGETATFYIYVGGGGQSSVGGSNDENANTGLGGWPGGARPGTSGSSGGGGGATVVDLNSTGTSSWDFSANDGRILVAGGGGGACNNKHFGESADSLGATAGTMRDCTTTRPKWMGGRAGFTGEAAGLGAATSDGGSGGAGYYGGLGGLETNVGETKATGAHGGSNYISSDWTSLINGTSSNGHTVNSSGDADDGGTMYPGYVFITYKYD